MKEGTEEFCCDTCLWYDGLMCDKAALLVDCRWVCDYWEPNKQKGEEKHELECAKE